MMRLPTIAVGALALSAISFTALADRVHVVFTDVKFDDKVAVNYLLGQKDHDKFLVVFSGLKDMNRANGDLHDFLAKAALGENAQEIEKFSLGENVKFVRGHSVDKPETHEANFHGTERSPDYTSFQEFINSGFLNEDDHLYVTQIAPTPSQYIEDLASKFYINRYHLVHGHNSKLHTFEWLKKLQSTVKQKSADARVVVTNNFASFVQPSSGSNQLFNSFNGYVPVEHLQSALEDPFHASVLLKMDEFLKKEALGVVLDISLKPSFKREMVDVEMAEAGVEVNKVELGELVKWVVEARRSETDSGRKLRDHFNKYIQNVIDKVEAGNVLEKYAESLNDMGEKERNDLLKKFAELHTRLSTHVKAVFKPQTPLTVQLCDANHVAAVFKAKEAAFKSFEFIKDKEKGIIMKVVDDKPSDGWTLQGLSGTTVLQDLINSFGGLQHSTILEAEKSSFSRM